MQVLEGVGFKTSTMLTIFAAAFQWLYITKNVFKS